MLHFKIDTRSLIKRMSTRGSLESSMKKMSQTLMTAKSIKKCMIWPRSFNWMKNNWPLTKSTQSNFSKMKLRKKPLSNNSIRNLMKNIWINDWPKRLMKNMILILKTMIQVLTKTPINLPENLILMKNNLHSTKLIPWNSSSKKQKKMPHFSNSMKNLTKRTSTVIFKELSTTMATQIHKTKKTTTVTDLPETWTSMKSNLLQTILTQSRLCKHRQNSNKNSKISCSSLIKKILIWKSPEWSMIMVKLQASKVIKTMKKKWKKLLLLGSWNSMKSNLPQMISTQSSTPKRLHKLIQSPINLKLTLLSSQWPWPQSLDLKKNRKKNFLTRS